MYDGVHSSSPLAPSRSNAVFSPTGRSASPLQAATEAGAASGVYNELSARDTEFELSPLFIDCRNAMLSDAREQGDLSPITSFPVELRAWLGKEGKPQVGYISRFLQGSRVEDGAALPPLCVPPVGPDVEPASDA